MSIFFHDYYDYPPARTSKHLLCVLLSVGERRGGAEAHSWTLKSNKQKVPMKHKFPPGLDVPDTCAHIYKYSTCIDSYSVLWLE